MVPHKGSGPDRRPERGEACSVCGAIRRLGWYCNPKTREQVSDDCDEARRQIFPSSPEMKTLTPQEWAREMPYTELKERAERIIADLPALPQAVLDAYVERIKGR